MSLVIECSFRRQDFSMTIDVSVADGEMIALHGPNGSGKSTVLHLIAGLLAVGSGRIELNGQTLDDTDWHGRQVFVQPEDRHVGFLPQGGALFPHMSAVDNVSFGVRARGMATSSARDAAMAMLERFGIADLADRRPHQLSGGQRQRVALARTLVVAPRILLWDEPTTALDEAGRSEVLAMLASVKESFEGPMVLVSHDRRDVDHLADRFVAIDHTVDPDGRQSRIA